MKVKMPRHSGFASFALFCSSSDDVTNLALETGTIEQGLVCANVIIIVMLHINIALDQGARQGRINHWANRANAWSLELEYQNTPLLVFHVFKLFTSRQNCRAF